MIGVIFMPSIFTHFVVMFTGTPKNRNLIFLNYCVSLFLSATVYSPLYAKTGGAFQIFSYWPLPGLLFPVHLAHFFANLVYSYRLIFKTLKRKRGIFREQIRYVLLGTGIGFLGGLTNYFYWYRIGIPPFLNICVSIGVPIITYGILRYRLMDIKIAFTRVGIFAIVYTLVLGIPLGIVGFGGRWLRERLGTGWYWLPSILSVILASAGPFIFMHFRRRTEDLLLKDQRRYQDSLRRVSATLTLIKNLERLLKFIVLRVARAVRVDFACIYIASDSKLVQKYPYTIKGFFPDLPAELSYNSELVSFLMIKRRPVFSEELSEKIRREFDLTGLIIPSFVRGRLLGFLILGPKSSGLIYTEEDTNIFGILANQLALAIENSAFIEESQKTQAQLFAAEQMASMGTMAGGMTHQINNRFHAIGMATSDSIDTLNLLNLEQSSKEELKTTLKEMRYNLERIQENTKHGGKIVNDFLNFSQPDRLQKEAKEFNLREPLERAIEMARIKTAFAEDLITKEIPNNLPKIQGNFVLIQDAYFNLLDNALDALTQRKNVIENKKTPEPESGYKGKILIKMFKQNTNLITQIKDNGIGMNEEAKKKVFVPFFTTKATTVKGTGLGLFVIQKIIEAHQGTISVESEYGKGTSFTITLPITKKKEGKDNAQNPDY